VPRSAAAGGRCRFLERRAGTPTALARPWPAATATRAPARAFHGRDSPARRATVDVAATSSSAASRRPTPATEPERGPFLMDSRITGTGDMRRRIAARALAETEGGAR
jgi:hypothetical protein